MSDLTRILSQIEAGDPTAAEQILPLVYDELRKLAAAKIAHEKPGQTLDATALVHEAYLRLVGSADDSEGVPRSTDAKYHNRAHFFAAAAEAMRRILIDRARRKQTLKHGGGIQRVEIDLSVLAAALPDADLLALDEALTAFDQNDPQAARLVRLHCFAGLTIEQSAEVLGLPERTAYRDWAYARTWLHRALREAHIPPPGE